MSVQDRVHDLLDPVVATLDVELVDVEFAGGTLRVTIDRDGGVTTESLAEVNRLISPILDQHDPIPGRYTLEVSSPGLERKLKRPDHYRRAIGEQVLVKLVPDAAHRRLRGQLVAVDASPGTVDLDVVEVDGVELDEPERRQVPLSEVTTARTVFEWGPAPKPGGPKAKNAKAKSSKAKNSKSKKKTKQQAPRGKSEVRDEQ